jgi:hypothetical protein
MKKHILGIAVFSLIAVSSFLLSFETIPSSELISTVETKEDLSEVNLNDLAFDILSVKYDSKTNQVTNDLRFYWKGKGNPPKFIYVNSGIYSPISSQVDIKSVKVNLLFGKNNVADTLVKTYLKASSTTNYYTDIWVSKEEFKGNNWQIVGFTKTSSILFVH